MKWQILGKSKTSITGITSILLKNRNIKNEKEFFNPKPPKSPKLNYKKAIARIKKAKKNKEDVVVYGDYDADGICATAILWEALHKFGLNVLPHIPDRFSEGYGINTKSVINLKSKIVNLSLIITVDNGIVAFEGIKKAKELGIDVIVLDHHQLGSKIPKACSVIHTPLVCGSALAYFFSKELGFDDGLDLAAIGTIADQMPLQKINRSIVKYGLAELNKTKRIGLRTLFNDLQIENIGTYEVNYIIAPRINAMGRLAHGLDSLRLLCTTKVDRAFELSKLLTKTNSERQKIVDEVVIHTRENVTKQKVIVIADATYHEGVIGLAAGKLVEEFYRPAIVISKKGKIAKASARSISGFNIIEAIKAVNLHAEGGGHPMAAGFSIETSKIEEFTLRINKYADELLSDEILERKLKVDMELNFGQLTHELLAILDQFNPTGLGNPGPTFVSKKVEVLEVKTVGRDAKHLKLKLKQDEKVFDAIWFNATVSRIPSTSHQLIDIVYCLESNTWNGNSNLQLKIKDIKVI